MESLHLKTKIPAGPVHPWIYRKQVSGSAGDGFPVRVYDAAGSFAGIGYYSRRSQIAVRLLTRDDEPIDQAFFDRRLRAACEARAPLWAYTDAYRAVSAEADGLPGFIADVYADTVVMQITTAGAERLKSHFIAALGKLFPRHVLFERSDTASRAREGLAASTGWRTAPGNTLVKIREGSASFLVDIERGHKTGFYLDQRASRRALAPFARKKTVLDVCCYTGAFVIQALVAGAAEATGADIKDEWLELAGQNAEVNKVAGRARFVREDAFDLVKRLGAEGQQFDIVIVDPPSFVKSRHAVIAALKGYERLNTLALRLVRDGGMLCTFSCSHHIGGDQFAQMIKIAGHKAHRSFTIMRRCHQDKDHPIRAAVPETEYLRGYFLQVRRREP